MANLWMSPRNVRYAPPMMAVLWIAALAWAWANGFERDPSLIVMWAFLTSLPLLGGFSALMTLWDFPDAQKAHPRLRTTLLLMLCGGFLYLWLGLVYLAAGSST